MVADWSANGMVGDDVIKTKQEWEIGDCLELLPSVETGSVDMILCDLPYGTTACSWDTIIPFEPLWREWKRIAKDNAAIVLTASQPFTSVLVMSNQKMFKHCWQWDKVKPSGFQIAKYRPMQRIEDVLVFCKTRLNYYPIMVKRDVIKKSKIYSSSDSNPIKHNDGEYREYTHKYPQSLLVFSNASQKDKVHPTQKPVTLFEYLIKTYTNEGDTVHDSCLGSGTTLEACHKTNRNCIGFEISNEWEHVYKKRLHIGERLDEWL